MQCVINDGNQWLTLFVASQPPFVAHDLKRRIDKMDKLRMILSLLATLLIVMGAVACNGDNDGNGEAQPLSFSFDFAASDHSWSGGFTDLPVGYEEDSYNLEISHTDRPSELGAGKALMIAGTNRSDDLFMFLSKGLTAADGVRPNTTYQLVFEVTFGTDAPAGAVGVGGPPGEAVWVKVGAGAIEPMAVEKPDMGDDLYHLFNLDKGRQNEDGADGIRIGDVAKLINEEFGVYELKTLNNADNPIEAVSDSEGNLWLYVGTDSGFEGRTALYYTLINVSLTPVE
jgi:hypothetical protein